MRMHLVFVAVLGGSFLGLHYWNTNAGKPASQQVAFIPYLKGLVGIEEPPPPPGVAERAVAWLKGWSSDPAPTAAVPAAAAGDSEALARAVAEGRIEDAAAMAETEFARVAAALDGEGPAAAPSVRPQPGQGGFGKGSCGDRAGGKFCSVGKTGQD